MDVQESALFLRDCLHEGLYCGCKGKRYATKVVTTPRSCYWMVLKDNSGEARASRTMTKRLEAEDSPRKALKLKEDQGHVSVLPAARAKEQL